ncbi:hypothetical protein [Saccharicrinis aurantiacus]|uniref:hypothetical protein n=1 Tax=Saccharicrinis aurantiacus TaxID=1849719 RepID=UPI0011151A6B|nr:hypothetical protein [Saccharicrinis aurantiacus]
MMSEKKKTNSTSYQDLDEKRKDKPTRVTKNKDSEIYNDLAEDFEDVLGDGFHGMNDDYYFDEDDM